MHVAIWNCKRSNNTEARHKKILGGTILTKERRDQKSDNAVYIRQGPILGKNLLLTLFESMYKYKCIV